MARYKDPQESLTSRLVLPVLTQVAWVLDFAIDFLCVTWPVLVALALAVLMGTT